MSKYIVLNTSGWREALSSCPQCERIGFIFREERKANGLSQAAVALVLGRPQSHVVVFERRERRLDVIEFVR
jgi:hypothetical protein